MPVRVRAVDSEIADVVTLRLEGAAPRGAFAPGQFNMLYAFGVGEAAISVSGDPAAPDTVHTMRALGAVTRALCALAPGQVVGVRGPFGQPWPVDVAAGGDLLLDRRGPGAGAAAAGRLSRASPPRPLPAGGGPGRRALARRISCSATSSRPGRRIRRPDWRCR